MLFVYYYVVQNVFYGVAPVGRESMSGYLASCLSQ